MEDKLMSLVFNEVSFIYWLGLQGQLGLQADLVVPN